jgi:hypothetical protein
VNEAWILFWLTDSPIHTEKDGDFNIVALIDVASCYILGNDIVTETDGLQPHIKSLLKQAHDQVHCLPQQLIVQDNMVSPQLEQEMETLKLTMESATRGQIWPIVGEAVQAFKQYLVTSDR